jgi:hypothetical protein
VRQAIAAGITTYLTDSEEAKPKRLKKGDPRLESTNDEPGEDFAPLSW